MSTPTRTYKKTRRDVMIGGSVRQQLVSHVAENLFSVLCVEIVSLDSPNEKLHSHKLAFPRPALGGVTARPTVLHIQALAGISTLT